MSPIFFFNLGLFFPCLNERNCLISPPISAPHHLPGGSTFFLMEASCLHANKRELPTE